MTNYSPIDQILRWHATKEPIALVTFNYDLLLETALRNFGFFWSEPERFLDSHAVRKVFKLHGRWTGLDSSTVLMRVLVPPDSRVLVPLHSLNRLRKLSLLARTSPRLGIKRRKRGSSCFPLLQFQSRARTTARLLVLIPPQRALTQSYQNSYCRMASPRGSLHRHSKIPPDWPGQNAGGLGQPRRSQQNSRLLQCPSRIQSVIRLRSFQGGIH